MKQTIILTIAFLLIGASIYALYVAGKKLNYMLQYESMVIETVKDTVKPECLK